MLLHIRPRLYSPFRDVALIDMDIEIPRRSRESVAVLGGGKVADHPYLREIGLRHCRPQAARIHLEGGVDLATRRPYPNKHYAVACRKEGHKAIDGILIETPRPVDEMHTTARWAIGAAFSVTHQVRYKLLDHDFDAASDHKVFWYACCEELGGWTSRVPAGYEAREPRMEVEPGEFDCRTRSEDVVKNEWIVSRHEVFAMPGPT